MNIYIFKRKKMLAFLILCLTVVPIAGCSTIQNLDNNYGGTTQTNKSVANTILSSEFGVAELGKISLFDEKNSKIAIMYTLRPSSSTEYGKYYDMTINWGEYVLSGSSLQFRSQDTKYESMALVLNGVATEKFINLLSETSEYKRLRTALDNIQEEKRKFNDKEEEIAYNLFWKGEVPSYDEAKRLEAQKRDVETREQQIKQKLLEFPYSASLPSSFTSSLNLVMKVMDTPVATKTAKPTPIPSVDTSVLWALSTPISSLPPPPAGYGYWKGPTGYNLALLGTTLPNRLYSWVTLPPKPSPTK